MSFFNKQNLSNQMLLSLFIGIICGFILKINFIANILNLINFDINIFKKIGTIFISLLKMISAPFIFSSMAVAILSLAENTNVKLKALTLRTVFVFIAMTFISAGLGIFTAIFLKPGYGVNRNILDNIANINAMIGGVDNQLHKKTIIDIIFDIVPTNLFDAFLKSNFLQVIFFTFIFSLGVLRMENVTVKNKIYDSIKTLNMVMLAMVKIIMKIAPVCTFFIMTWLIKTQDISILKSLIKLIGSMSFAAIFMLVVLYGSSCLFLLKLNPVILFRKLFPVQMLSFLTASSASSLPLGMKIAEKDLGVPAEKVNFIVPFGTAINMNGGVIYFTLTTIFIAQIFQVNLMLVDYIILFFSAILMSAGTAPIPGAAIFLLVNLLTIMNLPIEAVSLILGIDRILDMIRTCINVSGDVYASVIVSRSMKTLDKSIYEK